MLRLEMGLGGWKLRGLGLMGEGFERLLSQGCFSGKMG